jgi:hypothetical protein
VSLAAEIADLWGAGAPVVWLVTDEEERAVSLCRAAAQGFDARVAVWS